MGRDNLVYVEDELVRLVETLPISYAYVTNNLGKIIGSSDSSRLAVESACCYAWEPTWAQRQSDGLREVEFQSNATLVLSKGRKVDAGEHLILLQFPLLEHSSAVKIGNLFVALPEDQILQASRASAVWLACWLFILLAVVSGIAATLFSKKMSAPIEAMTRAIQRSMQDSVAVHSTLERVGSLKKSTSIREINTLQRSLVQLHETILTQQKTLEESRLAHLLAGLAASNGP